jgi:transcription termination factor Rho
MVNTRSSHPLQPNPLQPPPSAPGASNSPELAVFLKSMAESMEVLKKQNEELNVRLTAAEAQSSEKERERAERREKDRRDRLHCGKRHVNPHQEDNESTVQGENEENRDKSRRVDGGSRRDRSHREESPRGESRRERQEGEKSRGDRREGERSHRSRRHRDNEESRHSHHEAKMKDLEDKYTRMLR